MRPELERSTQQVPVKGFQMAEIKNQAMAFCNRALVERVGGQKIEERIGLRASLSHSRK
jgi:hypothetical protein